MTLPNHRAHPHARPSSAPSDRHVSPEQLATLVRRLDPRRADAPHAEWVKMLMSIHDGDAGAHGETLAREWSQQSPKYNTADFNATWKSIKPGAVTVATLIAAANEDDPGGTRAPQTSSKRRYTGLADYATAHGTTEDAFIAAGWNSTVEMRHCPTLNRKRPALAFMTKTGRRYRYIDGDSPAYASPKGYQRGWYGLERAAELATKTRQPLVICNGEASTVAAQSHGVAACAVTSGEKASISDALLAELRAVWSGEIIVAFDSDATGRKAAPDLAAQLSAAGSAARAVGLGGSNGFDLADFCRLHEGDSTRALTTLKALGASATSPASEAEARRPRFAIRTLDDLAQVQPPRWLLPDEVVAGAFNLIYGASGSGKTFYSIDRALRTAAMGRRVCYIATEDLAGLKIRVAAWRVSNPHANVSGFTWLGMDEGLDLANDRQVDELVAALRPLGFDLITIDTLREAHTGDENSSQDMAAVNRAIQRLIRETGAALDVVHHSGVNDGRERGSTALGANCDLKLKVSNDDGVVVVSCEKIRNGSPFAPRYYHISQVTITDSHAPVGVLRPTSQTSSRTAPLTQGQRKILEALALSVFTDNGAKTSQISEATGIPAGSLFRALSALKNRGYISQGSKGDPYTITSEGRGELAPDLVPPPEPEPDPVDYHTTITHQDAELSPLSSDYHDYHESDTLLSLTITTPRGDSDGSGERVHDRSEVPPVAGGLAGVPWASVRHYLVSGQVDTLRTMARAMWRVDPDDVLAGAYDRWPELEPPETETKEATTI